METKIFKSTKEDIEKAADIIRGGGLIAFPTETVYGLGADALNKAAVEKIYIAKGRPSDNPMIVHISDIDDLELLSPEITEDMRVLAKEFWPGPLTMVMKKSPEVPYITTGGLETVAVRMPEYNTALLLIEKAGCPIAAPSANLSGRPSPTKGSHVLDDMKSRIDGIIMGEDSSVGIESTVVDMSGDKPMVLRPGIITPEELSKVLNKKVFLDPALLLEDKEEIEERQSEITPKSPGMKYRHYAPKAEMVVFQGEPSRVMEAIDIEKERLEKNHKKVAVILYDNSIQAAREFFGELREADKLGVDVILAGGIEAEGLGFSVMNRMLKSAGYNVKKV